jgi:alanyl-tRNA synthetase
MTSRQIRQKFLEFFKNRGHKIVPSSSLIPSDTSVLFTTAGMQQFSLYLSGEKDPIKKFGGRHLISCQKCFRSDDIEEVGDDTHNTFFEMLGNWSIGQDKNGKYFKEEAIKYALEFFVNELELDKNKFYVTIFKGDENIPKDKESEKVWMENGIPEEQIKEFETEDNFWGPAGEIGPCGPCSEIHYDRGEKFGCGKPDCGPNCPYCQRFVEIWNLVFMKYYKKFKFSAESGQTLKAEKNEKISYEYILLPQGNVDTGIGFERVVSILQNKPSVYETDLFFPIIQEIEKLSSKKYNEDKKSFRIISDHLRGSCFLISEGILPSNLAQGYILRRLLRRTIRYAKILNLPNDLPAGRQDWYLNPIKKIIEIYGETYPEILLKESEIIKVIKDEKEKFGKTLEKGLKELNKLFHIGKVERIKPNQKPKVFNRVDAKEAFYIYQTYGFPIEMIQEELAKKFLLVDEEEFNQELKKHQEISRAGAEKKFGGHGIEKLATGSRTLPTGRQKPKVAVKLHTATHLLHAALREILGNDVKQMGSDINEERLRFDFSYSQKMTPEQIKKVEEIVNQKIKEDLLIKMEEMDYQKAITSGALAFFKEKYPKQVKVYSIRDFSKEICAGPHINRTGELGIFKIQKEKSSSAGVRRIKAVLE